ncbi:MAG: single-stranded DNA-binding protein [Chitinophagales bacterium]
MVNKVFLIGRLGKDPVIKHFQNDSAIAEFSLATTESYKDREGKWNEITDWHNIKLPNKFMAERAEKYLKKGSSVYVEGKIRTRSYDDKDGNKRYVTEIIAETFRMLDKKGDGSSSSGGGYEGGGSSSYSSPVNDQVSSGGGQADDDLPF